jgi:hypothetical protein
VLLLEVDKDHVYFSDPHLITQQLAMLCSQHASVDPFGICRKDYRISHFIEIEVIIRDLTEGI